MTPRPLYAVVPALAAALLAFSGCASPAAKRTSLPVAWLEALPKGSAAVPDVTGSYLLTGHVIGDKMMHLDRRPLETVLGLFFERDHRTTQAHQIELHRPDVRHLQVLATRDGATLAEVTLEVSLEPESGALLAHRTETSGGSNIPVGFVASHTVRLWRGRDGCLYARLSTSGAGVIGIVPFVDSGEAWGRWEPATPEGVARYVEELASRERARFGRVLPDFPALLDRDGAALTRATLGGKVVVLYFPSRRLQSYPMLATLRTLRERHSPPHLELVTVWNQPAAERDAVERFIAEQVLPGRHFFHPVADPAPTSSPGGAFRRQVLPGFASPPSPYFYVLDRDGRIAAMGPTLARLEGKIGALLADHNGPNPPPGQSP